MGLACTCITCICKSRRHNNPHWRYIGFFVLACCNTMNPALATISLTTVATTSMTPTSSVYRCTDANNKVMYTDLPCPAGQQQRRSNTNSSSFLFFEPLSKEQVKHLKKPTERTSSDDQSAAKEPPAQVQAATRKCPTKKTAMCANRSTFGTISQATSVWITVSNRHVKANNKFNN